jgi:membrane-bound lytic murein transglycosylase F
MDKSLRHSILFFIFCLIFLGCTSSSKKDPLPFWGNPVELDLEEIKERGFLRAIVDNSSTSYYVYRGKTMGYEYELLRNLAAHLDVNLRLVVSDGLMESFRDLNEGKADIIAINLEVSEQRKKYARFSEPILELETVLVQTRNNRTLSKLDSLHQKTVHIKKGTIYKEKLQSLSDSLGLLIHIQEEDDNNENLIYRVMEGEIDYTVVDNDVALVNATYYDNLDVSLALSTPSPVSWAIRKNSPELLEATNNWISRIHRTGFQAILYDKYFLNKKNSYFRNTSPFSSVSGGRISQFDEIIKDGADLLGWDWRLLASLVYKESRFDTSAISYAGAVGLLQLMPVTLQRFGVSDPNDPRESLRGGVNYLRYLDSFWLERVPDNSERIKFILASYNVGHGHVQDAWRLALKYNKDTRQWNNVAHYLERKSRPEIYRDPLVTSGYAKGHLAVRYVRDVMNLYETYKVLVDP